MLREAILGPALRISEFFGKAQWACLLYFMKKKIVCVILGLALVLGIFVIARWGNGENSAKAKKEATAQLTVLEKEAVGADREALARFEPTLDAALSQVSGDHRRLDRAATELTNICGTATLVYLSAYDRIYGTSKTSEYIAVVAGPAFTDYSKRQLQAASLVVSELAKELGDHSTQFCERSGIIVGTETGMNAVTPNVDTLQLPHAEAVGAAWRSSLAVGFFGLDVIFARQIAQSVVVVFRHVLGRIEATMLTSGTLVVADGPFPVGDAAAVVIGVGGSIWTAWDFYMARTELVPAVQRQLRQQANKMRVSIRKMAVARAYQIQQAHENARTQFSHDLLAQIN